MSANGNLGCGGWGFDRGTPNQKCLSLGDPGIPNQQFNPLKNPGMSSEREDTPYFLTPVVKQMAPVLVLMFQKSGIHQLRLVVYPTIYKGLFDHSEFKKNAS